MNLLVKSSASASGIWNRSNLERPHRRYLVGNLRLHSLQHGLRCELRCGGWCGASLYEEMLWYSLLFMMLNLVSDV